VFGPPAFLASLGVSFSERAVRFCRPTSVGIVTGDARPSGGGDVLVGPDLLMWADVVLPASDPLWVADVSVAPLWLGSVFVSVLSDLGVSGGVVHRGAFIRPSSRWCFDGVGPGEVLIEGRDEGRVEGRVEGRKVVGISQRRTRAGVLFQCALLPVGFSIAAAEDRLVARLASV
jgi:lipoate-protein ligase A